MNLLPDAHIHLWWLIDSPALSQRAHQMIEDADQVFVSVVSFWEASIKWRAGKLWGFGAVGLMKDAGRCGHRFRISRYGTPEFTA